MYHYPKFVVMSEAEKQTFLMKVEKESRRNQEKRLKREARVSRKKRLRKIVFYQTIDNPFDPDDEYNCLTALDERGKAIYIWQCKPYHGISIGDVQPEDVTSLDGWDKLTLYDEMHGDIADPWWWRWGDWKDMKIRELPGGKFDPMNGRVRTWTVKMYV